MLHLSEPFISAELAYRQEKIRASFAGAEARRRYRQERRARRNAPASPPYARRRPAVSR
jgi:hypothetical protein